MQPVLAFPFNDPDGIWYPGYLGLFAAKPVGGKLTCQAGETIAVERFAFDEIPSPLSLEHKRRIKDAIEGANGVVVLQEIKLPKLSNKISPNELYELRNKSGLSRQEFYLQMIESAVKETVEIRGSEL